MDKVTINLDDFDAAIFDMDGTMINNMEYHKKAWKEFAKRHGFDVTDEEFKEKFSGKKNDQIFKMILGEDISSEDIAKYTEEKEALYRELYAPDIQPIAGLHEVIGLFQKAGKKLAVATTAPKDNRDFGFKALGLENVFQVILGDEHVTKGKPHPKIYIETAKKLQVDPSRCIVFEDTPPGIQSGKDAGMKVVSILTTHSEEDNKNADYFVKDFTQLHFN
jgi:HAD superfamily hydrolase (TIGR01509 family)